MNDVIDDKIELNTRMKEEEILDELCGSIFILLLTGCALKRLRNQIIRKGNHGIREMDPLVFGDYSEAMKKNMGSRMLSFTAYESKLVKGTYCGTIQGISVSPQKGMMKE
ncbi:hypothetical protein Syun_021002 [Stephania yunnanensis]|uniref:Uncharacterized protein n=1 Tax=Stephania yunnanensis TaxID=152371 RepID=A0AAP0NQL8_9MAGN